MGIREAIRGGKNPVTRCLYRCARLRYATLPANRTVGRLLYTSSNFLHTLWITLRATVKRQFIHQVMAYRCEYRFVAASRHGI